MSLDSTLLTTTRRLPGGRSVLLIDLAEFGRQSIRRMSFGRSFSPQHVIAASDLDLNPGELLIGDFDLAGRWPAGEVITVLPPTEINLLCSERVVPCIRGWLALALGYSLPDRNPDAPRPSGDGTRGCAGAQIAAEEEADKVLPVSFRIEMLGPVDDDIRIQIDGVTVFNPRRNLGWYESPIVVEWSDSAALIPPDLPVRPEMRIGSEVTIDALDAWGLNATTARWNAAVLYSDSTTRYHTGGFVLAFASVSSPRTNFPADYQIPPGFTGATPTAGNGPLYGPWFETYTPLGGFTL